MKRLERAQRLMKKWGITYVDAIEDYRFFIKEAMDHSPKDLLIDACCGVDSSSVEGLHTQDRIGGFDIDLEGLKQNKLVKKLASGDLTALPFKENVCRAVAIHWGIEHIQHPLEALKEIYRVLKPGGRVVMMTTNTCHPFYFLARITPHRFHQYVRRKWLEIEEEETFKTYYRANTPLAMRSLLRCAAFSNITLRYRGNLSVYAFTTPTFYLGLLYEKITDWTPLRWTKMFMIASGDKTRPTLDD